MNILFFQDSNLAGFVEKARFGPEEAVAYAEFSASITAERLLIDIRFLEHICSRSLEVFSATKEHLFSTNRTVAVLRHKGKATLTLAPSIQRTAATIQIFDNPKVALDWLAASDFEAKYSVLTRNLLVQAGPLSLSPYLVTQTYDLGAFARDQGISTRTLQRRLKEDGIHFQALKTRTLIERARQLLSDPVLGAADVARRLDFSSAASFGEWFTKHHGVAPGLWRKRLDVFSDFPTIEPRLP